MLKLPDMKHCNRFLFCGSVGAFVPLLTGCNTFPADYAVPTRTAAIEIAKRDCSDLWENSKSRFHWNARRVADRWVVWFGENEWPLESRFSLVQYIQAKDAKSEGCIWFVG